MNRRKNIYVTDEDLKLLTSLKEYFGPTDSDVYRLGLRLLMDNLPLRTTQAPVIHVDGQKIANSGNQARSPMFVGSAIDQTEKQQIIDKLGGPFQMCPKHKGFYNSCWSLHK